MRIVLTLMFLTVLAPVFGQQSVSSHLYEGKIDGKLSITMYLRSYDNECTAELTYEGMYKYNNTGQWMQLDIYRNDKDQFVLVENVFTGVMILQKTNEGFSGVWISPDTKKQLKVELQKGKLTPKAIEIYEDKYDSVNYENHDC